jgi:hypothetical protein
MGVKPGLRDSRAISKLTILPGNVLFEKNEKILNSKI